MYVLILFVPINTIIRHGTQPRPYTYVLAGVDSVVPACGVFVSCMLSDRGSLHGSIRVDVHLRDAHTRK